MPGGTTYNVARGLTQLLTYALVDNARPAGDGIEIVMWFSLQDNGVQDCWGMLDASGATRLQYSAYQVFAATMGRAKLTQNASEPTYGTPPAGVRACRPDEVAYRIPGPFICDSLQWYKFQNDRTKREIYVLFLDPGNATNNDPGASRSVQFADSGLAGVFHYLGRPYAFAQQNGQLRLTIIHRPVYVTFHE
jgi:hypothetical protein